VTDKLQLKFDNDGLIPAVVQDSETGDVLMVAWMNAEALKKTLESGRTTFYSRSRGKLWTKGEKSGHVQAVKSVRVDCDRDTLLVQVEQTGGACHLGYWSCFFQEIDDHGNLRAIAEKIFDPEDVYEAGK